MVFTFLTFWQKMKGINITDFEKKKGAKVTKPHSSGGITDTAVILGEIVQNNILYHLVQFH
jgi:hypothetical protein